MALKILSDIDVDPTGYRRFWLYGKTLHPILNDVLSIANKPVILAHKDDIKSLAQTKATVAEYAEYTDIGDFIQYLGETEHDVVIVYNLLHIKRVADVYVRMLTRSDSYDTDMIRSLDYGEWETLKKLMADALSDMATLADTFVVISEEQVRIGDSSSEVNAIGPSISDGLKNEITHIFPEVFRVTYIMDKGERKLTYRTQGTSNTYAKDESLVLNNIETSFKEILDKISQMG